jgi:hypothetical protein
MVATGEFNERQVSGGDGYGAHLDRRNAYGRHDAPTVPHPGQGYAERANEYGRYDAPLGPSPSQGYQNQESYQQGYRSDYTGGPDRPSQYGPPQTQVRGQYDAPQGPLLGYGRGQGNAPPGEYTPPRNAEDRYGSGYGGPTSDRSERPYQGEAPGYYNQQNAPGKMYLVVAHIWSNLWV